MRKAKFPARLRFDNGRQPPSRQAVSQYIRQTESQAAFGFDKFSIVPKVGDDTCRNSFLYVSISRLPCGSAFWKMTLSPLKDRTMVWSSCGANKEEFPYFLASLVGLEFKISKAVLREGSCSERKSAMEKAGSWFFVPGCSFWVVGFG
jgi:hypothetical protein